MASGRNVSVEQVNGREIRLKGAGIRAYGRRSDGRAVLRSSVAGFLAQELMAALGAAFPLPVHRHYWQRVLTPLCHR